SVALPVGRRIALPVRKLIVRAARTLLRFFWSWLATFFGSVFTFGAATLQVPSGCASFSIVRPSPAVEGLSARVAPARLAALRAAPLFERARMRMFGNTSR